VELIGPLFTHSEDVRGRRLVTIADGDGSMDANGRAPSRARLASYNSALTCADPSAL
jgi:hypothetical protein